MPVADSPRRIVLDASVAVRWVVDEVGSAEAAALLELEVEWIAPRLLLAEAASALRRKSAEGLLSAPAAVQCLDGLFQAVTDGIVTLAEDERIIAQALMLATSLDHRVADCVYLAIAERHGAAIATADTKFARLARSRGVEVLRVPHA